MSLHAPLPPSSASRWAGQCPGSVPLEKANPETEQDQDAKEGDAAHWCGAETLRTNHATATIHIPQGFIAPNGVVINDEMLDAADMYVEEVRKLGIARDQLHIEERVENVFVHPDNWGTPDVWGFTYVGDHWFLHIPDFKFGHRFVDAFENWQCLDYAGGVLSRPEFRNLDWAHGTIVCTIVQPRNFHPNGPVRKWTVAASKLPVYLQQLRDAATEALGPNPRTIPGSECRDCRGRHQCNALHMTAAAIMDSISTALPVNLPPVALGVELRALHRAQEILKARVTGLEEQAKADIRRGTRVPFYSLEQGYGREKWKVDAAAVIATGEAFGLKLAKAPEPITPKQARDAGMDANVVASLAGRDTGELKLTPQDAEKARKVFGPV